MLYKVCIKKIVKVYNEYRDARRYLRKAEWEERDGEKSSLSAPIRIHWLRKLNLAFLNLTLQIYNWNNSCAYPIGSDKNKISNKKHIVELKPHWKLSLKGGNYLINNKAPRGLIPCHAYSLDTVLSSANVIL